MKANLVHAQNIRVLSYFVVSFQLIVYELLITVGQQLLAGKESPSLNIHYQILFEVFVGSQSLYLDEFVKERGLHKLRFFLYELSIGFAAMLIESVRNEYLLGQCETEIRHVQRCPLARSFR